jgi:hypothetical protein
MTIGNLGYITGTWTDEPTSKDWYEKEVPEIKRAMEETRAEKCLECYGLTERPMKEWEEYQKRLKCQ